jgi:high-affinity Fe2+/Pb2+ permease
MVLWRVLKIAGWTLLGLVFLAVAREGWEQLLLAGLGVLGFAFLLGALGFGDR